MIKVKGLEIDVGYCFKNVTVTALLGYRNNHQYVRYSCVCGVIKETRIYSIINSENFNCGCINRSNLSIRRHSHGKSKSKEYQTWTRMKGRCYNKNNNDYPEYGGRGITVCDRWLCSFDNFLEDMGSRPEGFSLDRIDVNAGYTPENCRWTTAQQQAYNQRVYKSNKSGKSGVTWSKKSEKWEVRISKDGVEYFLGLFTSLDGAIECRESAELKYYGYIK